MVRKDIYWQFAEMTDYCYWQLSSSHPNWYIQTLIELQPGKVAQDLHDWFRNQGPTQLGFVSQHYRGLRLRHCAAWVARGALAQLPQAIVQRFKIGLPTNPNALHPYEALRLWRASGRGGRFAKLGHPATMTPHVVTGIIDDRIDTTAAIGSTARLMASWDQNTNGGIGVVPPRFGYKLLPPGEAPKPSALSHGSLVASIAAGQVTPQYLSRQTLQPTSAMTDAASTLPVMTVQLRRDTVADTSGGALAVNVLDGLHFMLANLPLEAKLAVNISFGTMAGSHDGSGILESAMDELVGEMGGRLKIVLPTGNARQAQAHANIELEPSKFERLTWRVLPDDRTPSYVEIWTEPDAQFEVTLTSPDGTKTITCLSGGSMAGLQQAGAAIAALIPNDKPASSMTKQVVLVAMAPTRSNNVPCAPHGDWTIQVRNIGQTFARFNCWIERDNASFGQKSKGRQSYFVEPSWPRRQHALQRGLPSSVISEEGTLNGIATGNAVTVVGGYRLSDSSLAAYSSAGGLGVRSPDGVAPGDESMMLRGIAGRSNSGTSLARLSGTSAAAPWVTRDIVNAWAGTPSRTAPPNARPTSHNAGSPTRSGNTTWK